MFISYARNQKTSQSDYDFLIVTSDVNYNNDLTRNLLGKFFEYKIE